MSKTVRPPHLYALLVAEFHAWLHNYLTYGLTVAKATLLGMTKLRTYLVGVDEGMKTSHTDATKFPETVRINEIWTQEVTLSQGLVRDVNFFSTSTIATAAEKTATMAVEEKIDSLRGIGELSQVKCFDTVTDVSDVLLAGFTTQLTTLRLLETVQTMHTLSEELAGLLNARSVRMETHRGPNSGFELKRAAEPVLVKHFDTLGFISERGTAAEKTGADELIDFINTTFGPLEAKITARSTKNAKKNGEEKPEHKPEHKPDNRPEGVEPNEEGDEPDNGGNSSDNGGNSSDNGGDSGNSGDNNQDPPSGGNNGGSDKPPNPESPD